MEENKIPSPKEVLLAVVKTLDVLEIKYMIGGSFASGAYGIPRMTNDADIVIEIGHGDVEKFLGGFKKGYYVDLLLIKNAINNKSSFNIIHLESMFKIDFFVSAKSAVNEERFKRRKLEKIFDDKDEKIFLTSPEDIIIAKLEWYKKGNEVSDRQYRDVMDVIKVQNEKNGIDWQYLNCWADKLGVGNILKKVIDELGTNPL